MDGRCKPEQAGATGAIAAPFAPPHCKPSLLHKHLATAFSLSDSGLGLVSFPIFPKVC